MQSIDMRTFAKKSIIIIVVLLSTNNIIAQTKFIINTKVVQSPEDSLWKEFSNTIYYTFYNPSYWKHIATYTMYDNLKSQYGISEQDIQTFVDNQKNATTGKLPA